MTLVTTEARHPDAAGLQDRPPAEAAAILLDAQIAAAAAVRPALAAISAAAKAAADALAGGGRLGYAGAGSSGVMALSDALELAGTFGIPPEKSPALLAGGAASLLHMTGAVEDDPALAAADLAAARLGAGDALIAVSASGATSYTLAALDAARANGVFVIGVANVAGSSMLARADIAILLDTGAEVVSGSTRMGAATAQKIALNLISTLAALRLGHVHDGMMVNVVADNAKLRDRAQRIVAAVSGAGPEAAASALDATAGAVKPAILVAAGAPDAAAADRLLAETGGRLGPALDRTRRTSMTNAPNGAANRETSTCPRPPSARCSSARPASPAAPPRPRRSR